MDGSINDYCTYGLWNTYFGGVYAQSSDYDSDVSFGVTDDVHFVSVGFAKGTNVCRLSRFWVYATDGTMGRGFSWPGYETGLQGANLATAPPTDGAWKKGKILLNDNVMELGDPTSMYIVNGWRCIASGTPGTWVEMRQFTGN